MRSTALWLASHARNLLGSFMRMRYSAAISVDGATPERGLGASSASANSEIAASSSPERGTLAKRLHRVLAEHVDEAGALGVGLQDVDRFAQAQLGRLVQDGPRLAAFAEDLLGRDGLGD